MFKICISFLFIILFCLKSYEQQNLKRVFQPQNVNNKIPYGNNADVGKFVFSKDAKIYYEVYGKGQTIVLLHGGILGSTIELAEFIDKLKTNYQVIAISSRGHGKSDIGTNQITLEQKAEDVMAVVNTITKDSIIILGFSDGAYTGYKVASMYPNRIKKLIAIGAGELLPGLKKLSFNTTEFIKLDTAYWSQQFKLMPQPERLQEFWTKMENLYNSLTISKEFFGTIKCPVLLIAGELDKNAPLSSVVSAYYMIPNSQLCIIPNTGHGVFLENFSAVWESIIPFLGRPVTKYFPLTQESLESFQASYNLTTLENEPVVKVIKDPTIKLFDEPTFIKIKGEQFKDGEIEIKVLSKLMATAPELSRGFIGLAFRINADNSKFESIYLRPANGRAEQQIRRNHTIQYFSYPNFKFDRLRKESPAEYETNADIGLNEWITMKIVVKGSKAVLYLNNNSEPAFIVSDLKNGSSSAGNIGLWIDVGTEGYFKELIITHY